MSHPLYRWLGSTALERRKACQALFEENPDTLAIDSIRGATNKVWVPGSDRFRLEMEYLLQRQTSPKSRGGDRKPAEFRGRRKINRV